MATEILMVKIRQCLKDLTTLAETISKSAENEKKYAEIKSLVIDILGELAADNPNSEKVEETCCNLKDTAKEYNDAGDNLDVKKASSGLASRIGTIKPVNYKEFLEILIQEDKEEVLINLTQPTSGASSGDLVKLAWECYQNQHYDEAFKYAQQAKNNKILSAYNLLGIFYEEGIGTSKNINTAYKIYFEGAQMGNADCQFQVYIHLLTGIGVNKNLDSAYEWLSKAANNQHSIAMREFAKLHIINANYNDAYYWFTKAVNAGDDESKAWIGFCYEKGYGVERDIYHAKNIYNQEINRGNEKAKELYESLLKSEKEAQEEKRRYEEHKKRIEEEKRHFEEEKAKQEKERKKKTKSHGCLWLLFLIGTLWAGYQFWYKDYKRDKDAPRSYVYATNLFLRSSAIADVEYNRIATIPYGSELIIYSNENGWAYVKANGEKGYVASDFLLNAQEFHLLNGIWGNEDAKEAVPTAKCRLAMLNYLKDNGMKTGNSAWQLYAKPKEIKPNSVLFPRLNDGYDNFTEFAFILKDNQTGNRKLALYCFEEDETPVFRYTEDAPTKGDIKSITYSKWNNKYKVVYSNQEFTYTPKAKDEPVKEPLNVVSNKLTVLAAVFADTDYDRNILTGYGQQLYSDMQYLTGKVSYRKQFATQETVTLQVKIIRPNGTIDRGNTSPAGCSFEQKITLSEKEGVFEMLGWGSTSGKLYSPGTYHYEIWMDGTKLYSQAIDIQEKAEENIVIPDDMVFEVAEQMPEFPNGGMVGVMQYLGKNIKYPATAQENGIQGRVTVQFVVNKDGSITDVKIVKGIDPNLDKEAMRVVANMPKWKPGKIGGKPVRVKYVIPVNFRLN